MHQCREYHVEQPGKQRSISIFKLIRAKHKQFHVVFATVNMDLIRYRQVHLLLHHHRFDSDVYSTRYSSLFHLSHQHLYSKCKSRSLKINHTTRIIQEGQKRFSSTYFFIHSNSFVFFLIHYSSISIILISNAFLLLLRRAKSTRHKTRSSCVRMFFSSRFSEKIFSRRVFYQDT